MSTTLGEKISFQRGTSTATPAIANGNLVVLYDEKAVYVDIDGARLRLGDIAVVASLPAAPIEGKFYLLGARVYFYSDAWRELQGKTETIETLSGTSVTIAQGRSYSWTLGANGTLDIEAGTAGVSGWTEIDINPGTYTVTGGTGLTLADSLVASEINHCAVHWIGTTATLYVTNNKGTAPVASVNGKTGEVALAASDVSAIPAPAASGTSGQVLTSDASGNASWDDIPSTVAITTLSGTACTIAVGGAYSWTLAAASTLDIAAGTAGYVGYAEIDINPSTFTVTGGTNLTLVDSLTASAVNHCVVKWTGTTARLYVVEAE